MPEPQAVAYAAPESTPTPTSQWSDLAGRLAIVGLYGWLVARVLDEWRRTGHVTGLLLLTSSALLVYFTVRRRRAQTVERSWVARGVALVGTLGSLGFKPSVHSAIPDLLTAWLTLIGTGITISGIFALGRSFGVVPANRGIVRHGVYRWIRHPLYTGYLLSHIGFILSFPSVWNVTLWLIADSCHFARILLEERLLKRDPAYLAYMSQVRWRMLPGIF